MTTEKEKIFLADCDIDLSDSFVRYSFDIDPSKERLPYTFSDMGNATNPDKFISFLKSNFSDPATIETLLYFLSLIPAKNTEYKYGTIFWGKSWTGKTTLIQIIEAIFPELITTLPLEEIQRKPRRHNEATPHIANLDGKGAAIIRESAKNFRIDTYRWKMLTCGDTIWARRLYQPPFQFIPTAQVIVVTNYFPNFEYDESIIERLLIIPFLIDHENAKMKKTSDILDSLRPEFPAIVKMLLEYYIQLKTKFKGKIPLSKKIKEIKKDLFLPQKKQLQCPHCGKTITLSQYIACKENN
jgi:phage/plasmid-associated DNA primase